MKTPLQQIRDVVEALERIASCEKRTDGDVVDIARTALSSINLDQIGEMLGGEWRDIDSAPDSGRILVLGGRYQEPAIIDADGSYWRKFPMAATPTHWMPLPASPTNTNPACQQPDPTSLPSTDGAEKVEPVALTIAEAWQDLVDKSDRTSPEEYPDMALITRDELADYMESAHPPKPDIEAERRGMERAAKIADSHACKSLDAVDKVVAREIATAIREAMK